MLKSIFLIFCLSCASCVTTKYIDKEANCLINNPQWQSYFDVLALRDVMIRADSISFTETVKDTLGNNLVSFRCFGLFVKMKTQVSGPPIFRPNRKPSYISEDIQLNLFVSDTLAEYIIANLRKEDDRPNIEKGYIQEKSFLYVNDYNNSNVYVLINLHSRIAYKLEQDKENSKYTYKGNLEAFVRYGCRQGIRFIGKHGVFSFGDYTM